MTAPNGDASLAAKPAKVKRSKTLARVLFVGAGAASVSALSHELTRLAERGYPLEVVIEEGDAGDLEALRRSLPGLQIGLAPAPLDRRWGPLARILRWWLDHARALADPQPDPAGLARIEAAAPPGLARLARLAPFRGPRWIALMAALERRIPPDAAVCALFDRHKPSVLMISPLLEIGSSQADYVRAASAAGVRSLFLVSRWDQFSNGGSFHAVPDWVLVWNSDQRRIAVERFGVLPQYTAVVGAPGPSLSPAMSRKQLEAQLGLDLTQPLFVYLAAEGSSEAATHAIRRWVREIRSHENPALRNAALAVSVGDAGDMADALAEWARNTGRTNLAVVAGPAAASDALQREAAAVVAGDKAGVMQALRAGQPVLLAPDAPPPDPELQRLRLSASPEAPWLELSQDWPGHLQRLLEAARGGEAQAALRAAAAGFARPHGVEFSPGTALCNHVMEEVTSAPPAFPPAPVQGTWLLTPLNLLASVLEGRSPRRPGR